MSDDENNSSAYLEKNLNIYSVFVLDVESHAGVNTVEATQKVFGKYSRWFLFIGYSSFFLSSFPQLLSPFVSIPADRRCVGLG